MAIDNRCAVEALMSIGQQAPHLLCIVYQMDPRGLKVGGIETHVRTLLERHPADFEVALIGIDAIGNLPLGRVHELEIGGRRVRFLPVIHYPDDKARDAARRLTQSLSLRFTLGLARHLPAIRRLIAGRPVSFEIERNEAAFLPWMARRPFAMIVHNEYKRDNRTDSLVSRYWRLYRAGELAALTAADRILCVNPAIMAQIERERPAAAARSEVMTVSVDTRIFRPTPFDVSDGVLRLVYAGRLEAQKDPPLMFETVHELKARLDRRVELHLIGNSEPRRYQELAAIEDVVVEHGYQRPEGVARILARAHMGLLTSSFEGLPCFLLEALASGRPMAAIRLPQFDPLIVPEASGVLVERRESRAASAAAMADAIAALWEEIRRGRVDTARVAARAEPYSVDSQLPRLFAIHRQLQRQRFGGRALAGPTATTSPGA